MTSPEELEKLAINWMNADSEDAVVDAGAAMRSALHEIAATMRAGRLTWERATELMNRATSEQDGYNAIADAAVLAAMGEDLRDAERYRWLKSKNNIAPLGVGHWKAPSDDEDGFEWLYACEADAAIDAAIAQKGQQHDAAIGIDLASGPDRTAVFEVHADDFMVDSLAAAMKAKMAKQRARGYGGWDDPTACPAEFLQRQLFDHIAKGDPVDVANFAGMLFARGETTTAPAAPQQDDKRTQFLNDMAELDALTDAAIAAKKGGAA